MTSALSTGVQLVLIASFLGWLLFGRRVPALRRWDIPVLALLAAVGIVSHLDFFRHYRSDRGGGHFWEFYHYAVGTEYFPELGYTGLYDATVVADFEDDRLHYNGDQWIRSLESYQWVPRADVVQERERVKRPFSAERWRAFKRDIATYRAAHPPAWRTANVLRDHGYNGSPLTTAVLGFIARNSRLEGRSFVATMGWFDPLLILAAALLIGWLCGARAGLLFLFFWSVNPFNDYAFIGGGYLRYLYFVALALGVVAYVRGMRAVSGALIGVSALFAVFPGILFLALAANNLLGSRRAAVFRLRLPFYLSFVISSLLLVGATSLLHSPDDRNVWIQFAENTRLHRAHLTPNNVGLVYPFLFSPQHSIREINASFKSEEPRNWVEESRQTLRERRVFYWLALGVALLWILLYLRRAEEQEAFLGALALLFTLLFLSHYYYCVLALVPFMVPRHTLRQVALAVLFGTVAALRFVPGLEAMIDLRFCVSSVLLALFFGVILHPALAGRKESRPGDCDPLGLPGARIAGR